MKNDVLFSYLLAVIKSVSFKFICKFPIFIIKFSLFVVVQSLGYPMRIETYRHSLITR